MTNIRQRLSAAADRLFATFDTGGDNSPIKGATYTRITGAAAYDTASGTVTTPTSAVACKGYFEDWRQNEINGDTVKVGDRKFSVRGDELGFEPSSKDSLTVQGIVWSIVDYAADPAGIIFMLHIRMRQ